MTNPVTRFFQAAWTGQAPLWQPFWLLNLLSGPIIFVVYGLLFFTQAATAIYLIADTLVLLPMYLFQAVCVWRCAANTKYRIWGYLAQTLVGLNVLVFFLYIARDLAHLLMNG